jgi:hypothetical protein
MIRKGDTEGEKNYDVGSDKLIFSKENNEI